MRSFFLVVFFSRFPSSCGESSGPCLNLAGSLPRFPSSRVEEKMGGGKFSSPCGVTNHADSRLPAALLNLSPVDPPSFLTSETYEFSRGLKGTALQSWLVLFLQFITTRKTTTTVTYTNTTILFYFIVENGRREKNNEIKFPSVMFSACFQFYKSI